MRFSPVPGTPYQGLDSCYIDQSDRGDTIISNDGIRGIFCDETDVDSDK